MTLQKDARITLNQFVGQEGLQTSKALSTSCVNFASDASSYTIPQAIPKMKARRVFVQLGSNDVDGSVSVDSFIADYKQFLQNIHSAYAYCGYHRGVHSARYRGQHERCRDPDPH